MRTRVPYLLGLTCAQKKPPPASLPLTPSLRLSPSALRFISASTSHSQLFGCCHNKSIKLPLQDCVQLLLSRPASCISFEMYEVYILSLLFI